MTTKIHPNGATFISPYLTVVDVKKAAEFYQKAFNFTSSELMTLPDGTPVHGALKYKDQIVMIGKQGAYNTNVLAPCVSGVKSPMALYIYCDEVDSFYQNAVAAGAISVVAPQNTFWGDRMCCLQCPDGYEWSFATHLADNQ